jgi:hypothetical protein
MPNYIILGHLMACLCHSERREEPPRFFGVPISAGLVRLASPNALRQEPRKLRRESAIMFGGEGNVNPDQKDISGPKP